MNIKEIFTLSALYMNIFRVALCPRHSESVPFALIPLIIIRTSLSSRLLNLVLCVKLILVTTILDHIKDPKGLPLVLFMKYKFLNQRLRNGAIPVDGSCVDAVRNDLISGDSKVLVILSVLI